MLENLKELSFSMRNAILSLGYLSNALIYTTLSVAGLVPLNQSTYKI